MMLSKESIYNIILPPEEEPIKPRPLRSKEEKKLDLFIQKIKESEYTKPAATFGYKLGSLKPDTTKFMKKHAKEPIIVHAPIRCSAKAKFKAQNSYGPPIYNMWSGNNFINKNAITQIHSHAKPPPPAPRRYVTKKNYGKVPHYLETRINEAIRVAKQRIDELEKHEMGICAHPGTHKLEERERYELLHVLKTKWKEINDQYQRLSCVLDTESKKKRKERYEAHLAQIERDVSSLSRRVILVVQGAKSCSESSWRNRGTKVCDAYSSSATVA